MHSQKKFKQMVLFVEACESGSMFVDLSSTDNGVLNCMGLVEQRTGDEVE